MCPMPMPVCPAMRRYSWILTSLVGAVYMFGFILMCPQVGHALVLSR